MNLQELRQLREDATGDVVIQVKHSGILQVPEGKSFSELPLSHYEKLVKDVGYSEVIKALNNLVVWNKNKNPDISFKAGEIIDLLQSKHTSLNESNKFFNSDGYNVAVFYSDHVFLKAYPKIVSYINLPDIEDLLSSNVKYVKGNVNEKSNLTTLNYGEFFKFDSAKFQDHFVFIAPENQKILLSKISSYLKHRDSLHTIKKVELLHNKTKEKYIVYCLYQSAYKMPLATTVHDLDESLNESFLLEYSIEATFNNTLDIDRVKGERFYSKDLDHYKGLIQTHGYQKIINALHNLGVLFKTNLPHLSDKAYEIMKDLRKDLKGNLEGEQ